VRAGLVAGAAAAALEWQGNWHVSAAALLGLAYYAVVPTVLGFVLWYAGAARVAASEAALFTAVLPVSALLFAAVVLQEEIRRPSCWAWSACWRPCYCRLCLCCADPAPPR
jgi:drug/metabolite transporter (DMT)-like permease